MSNFARTRKSKRGKFKGCPHDGTSLVILNGKHQGSDFFGSSYCRKVCWRVRHKRPTQVPACCPSWLRAVVRPAPES